MTKPKPISRQARWQHRAVAAGRCRICGRPRTGPNYCTKHALVARRTAFLRRRTLSGIPLDAPLIKSGRPRLY